MLDLGSGKESASSSGDWWMGLPFSERKNNGKPHRSRGKKTSSVLLSVEYLWDILGKLSTGKLELWIWCPGDT